MTRKRFIKLLMSYGYSRNMAVQIAENVQRTKLSYADAIKLFRTRIKISWLFKDLRDGLMEVAKNIKKLGERIRNEMCSKPQKR